MSLLRRLFLTVVLTLTTSAAVQAAPKVLKKVPPEFPAEAIRKQISTGTVKAKIIIGADGRVQDVEIVEADPKRIFDRATIDALKEWRFEASSDKQTHEVKLVFNNDD